MTKLSEATLDLLPREVARPRYDRAKVSSGVIHFGPGAFHRAHQAPAFDGLLHEDPRWGITGISLNSTSVADALNPQDGLYTLALLDKQSSFQVVGSITRLIDARSKPDILSALAAPETRIVSTTVTEKGYCLAADGTLDFSHAAIVRDLQTPANPESVIGWIAKGLDARRAGGLGGVTVLSCDNLADNGRKLGSAVRAFAQAIDPTLADWIANEVRFPCSMVDSITPATDDALRARVRDAIGLEDSWPIQRERFTQWVIEDDFVGERPALDRHGATFSNDVRGYELAKLRLLNGAHSTLAYLGLGLGHVTVADAMREPALADFVERLMRDDIAPSLTPPAGLDLGTYITAILARFRNPAIEHHLSQIAWDGSQKLPYRLLDTIREASIAGRPIDRLAVPVAGWLRFLDRAARQKAKLVDPLAETLIARASDPRAILAMPEIFGDLTGDDAFRDHVLDAFDRLSRPDGFDPAAD